MNNGDYPANPLTGDAYIDFSMYDESKGGSSSYNPECQGLTKREAFAMAAMQGMSSNPEFYGQSVDFAKNIAVDCVKFADALLAELSK